MIQELLKLGNQQLYEKSMLIKQEELSKVNEWINDLHDTLMDYRSKYEAGRAIAAPQIGIKKRLIYMFTDKPYVFINPQLSFPDKEKYVLLDDCMSFPGLIVKVERYKKAIIRYNDVDFNQYEEYLEGDLSELLQHEYDHLDGILATMRAVDNKSFILKTVKRGLGFTYFLTRGTENVLTEIFLHFFAYNMKRLINILGVEELRVGLQG